MTLNTEEETVIQLIRDIAQAREDGNFRLADDLEDELTEAIEEAMDVY